MFCRNGIDMCGALCRDGVAVDDICRDAAVVCASVTPITAVFTYAPTVQNLGGADPNAGTLDELLDVPAGATGTGLNKGIYAVVSDVQGGDGGPYTVDFGGLPWEFEQENLTAGAAINFSSSIAQSWGLNQHLFPVTGAGLSTVPTVVGTTTGAAPAAAVVSGVMPGTDFASYIPQVRSSGTNTDQTLEFRHRIGAGTVTITDSSGNSAVISAPFRFDSWQRPAGGGGSTP